MSSVACHPGASRVVVGEIAVRQRGREEEGGKGESELAGEHTPLPLDAGSNPLHRRKAGGGIHLQFHSKSDSLEEQERQETRSRGGRRVECENVCRRKCSYSQAGDRLASGGSLAPLSLSRLQRNAYNNSRRERRERRRRSSRAAGREGKERSTSATHTLLHARCRLQPLCRE